VSSRQGDLFQQDPQADLFGEESPTPVYRADPDAVRQELYKILAEARAAQTIPWDARRTTLYRTIFPQMTNWLPAEEGAQLRFEFETELARLEAA
jgi:tRNA nucleotidyltransferase/poly(A) polymerase